jgi:hypothetical protein
MLIYRCKHLTKTKKDKIAMSSSSAFAWFLHELGLADFNDKRLTKRGVQIATAFLDHPQSSSPQASLD